MFLKLDGRATSSFFPTFSKIPVKLGRGLRRFSIELDANDTSDLDANLTRTETIHDFGDGYREDRKHVEPDSPPSVHDWMRAVEGARGWAEYRMPLERGGAFARFAELIKIEA